MTLCSGDSNHFSSMPYAASKSLEGKALFVDRVGIIYLDASTSRIL